MAYDAMISRFPTVELSYETIAHKKVYIPSIVVAIPFGPKSYLWITFGEDASEPHACYTLELNRNKIIVSVRKLPHADWYSRYSHGTVLYGTWVQTTFVAEDIYYYRGIYLRSANPATRIKYLYDILSDIPADNIRLAQTFLANSEDDILSYKSFGIHHLQVRKQTDIAPFLNILLERNGEVILNTTANKNKVETIKPQTNKQPDFRRPQFRLPTVFVVRAEIQPDLYSLFTAEDELFGAAYIPSYKQSIYMNSLFRRIRENQCIESAEDSEDEAEFENTAPDKFVDLSKKLYMECIWSPKFRRWTPVSVVENGGQAIAMRELVAEETPQPMNIKNTGYHNRNGIIGHREKYPTETSGRVGGVCGQYRRYSRGETQFAAARRYPENGQAPHKTFQPSRNKFR